jgi:hypothetical protein
MFEKTLTDVVKGIRASKRDTGLYISQCIAEIKTEIASADMYVKANALQKLTFLQMMGYSMNWASFATIEVMSSAKFAHKRVGYLAASQGFTPETDVILLTTNLLKKELRGATGNGGASMHGVYEAGLAINYRHGRSGAGLVAGIDRSYVSPTALSAQKSHPVSVQSLCQVSARSSFDLCQTANVLGRFQLGRRVVCGQRHYRALRQKSQKLPAVGTRLFSTRHLLEQQLDAD